MASARNHAPTPERTVRRTASGARSNTVLESDHTVTPHPNKNPPVSADKNRVSGWSNVVMPSTGQLKRSSVHRAGSRVRAIVPKKNTGPNDPMTNAVTFSHFLWRAWVIMSLPRPPVMVAPSPEVHDLGGHAHRDCSSPIDEGSRAPAPASVAPPSPRPSRPSSHPQVALRYARSPEAARPSARKPSDARVPRPARIDGLRHRTHEVAGHATLG